MLKDPSAADGLPADAVAHVWGYEADHPFAAQADVFRRSGRPFVIAPGTSSWSSLGGRTTNALANIARALDVAVAAGAEGSLLTDWGDEGHLQPAFVSWPALIAHARQAWTGQTPTEATVAALVDRWLVPPSLAGTGVGRWILDLGRIGDCFAWRPANRQPLHRVLLAPTEGLDDATARLAPDELERAGSALRRLEEGLPASSGRSGESALLLREMAQILGLLTIAQRRARAHRNRTTTELRPLRRDLARCIGEHEELWLARNRPGGLHESSGRLRRTFAAMGDKLAAAANDGKPATPP